MRQPNHIILDFEFNSNLNNSNYWAINYIIQSSNNEIFLNNIQVFKKYNEHKHLFNSSKLLKNQQKHTIRSNKYHNVEFLRSWEKDGIEAIFKPLDNLDDDKLKHILKYSKHEGRDSYFYITLPTHEYQQQNLKFILNKYKNDTKKNKPINLKLNTWLNLININFLRKERLYTKLKYSRSPAFDIVSGGAAALLAGFIGFLISEKFGYELVDSGDFYYLFMYLVFLSFSVRPLITVSDATKGFLDAFSIKRVLLFYISLIQIFFKKLK